MTFNVRIFGHRGTRQLQQVIPNQFTSQISEVLVQPYDWAQLLVTAGSSPVNSVVVGPQIFGFNDLATLVAIEIPDGQVIRYEFNIPGRFNGAVNAGNNSPKLSGFIVFAWTVGTVISIVEAASFP